MAESWGAAAEYRASVTRSGIKTKLDPVIRAYCCQRLERRSDLWPALCRAVMLFKRSLVTNPDK